MQICGIKTAITIGAVFSQDSIYNFQMQMYIVTEFFERELILDFIVFDAPRCEVRGIFFTFAENLLYLRSKN